MSSSAHTGTLTPPPRPPHPPFPGGEGGASGAGRVAPEQREQPRLIVRALRRRPLRTEHPAFTAPRRHPPRRRVVPGGAACPPRASRSPAAPRSRARPRRRRTIPRTATARATCPAASPRAPLRTRPARGRNPRESRNHRPDEVVARRPAHDNDREPARHSPIKAQLDIMYIIDHRSKPRGAGQPRPTYRLGTPLRSLLRARAARRARHSRLPRERERRNPHVGHRAACTSSSQDHSHNGRSAKTQFQTQLEGGHDATDRVRVVQTDAVWSAARGFEECGAVGCWCAPSPAVRTESGPNQTEFIFCMV